MKNIDTVPFNTTDWQEINRKALVAQLNNISQLLIQFIQANFKDGKAMQNFAATEFSSINTMPPALAFLGKLFDFSKFEYQLLLLCIGVELDPKIAALCAEAQGDYQKDYPSVQLALALFACPWAIFASDAPLRYWDLIELPLNVNFCHSRLMVTEWVLF